MEYKVIDMETYPRRDQFELFNSYAYPYMGLTVNVDITDFLRKVKEREVDFFLSFCWCVYRAANAVPEFKQRIKDGRIVEYPEALMSTTLSMPDGNYCYCDLDCKLPFDQYLPKNVVKTLDVVSDIAVMVLGYILLTKGIEVCNSPLAKFGKYESLPWLSRVWMYIPIPLAGGSMIIFEIEQLVDHIKAFFVKEVA